MIESSEFLFGNEAFGNFDEEEEKDEGKELCRDIQMKLPDELWALDYMGRYMAGKFNQDFAKLEDGRTFLFGVVEVPLRSGGSFTWGVWAEVDPKDHDFYAANFQSPTLEGLRVRGRIANEIPGYEDAMGASVLIGLHKDRRPSFEMLEGSLAKVQKNGLSQKEHEALDRILFGEDEEDL